jgi:replication factor A1
MVELTTNFLTDLVHAPENAEIFDSQPTVQFLSVKPVDPTQAGTPQERYRVIISDGTNYLQSMMATQLNHFIHEQAVIKHSIVKLTRFTLSTVRDKRYAIYHMCMLLTKHILA